jgi:hypothetical protein
MALLDLAKRTKIIGRSHKLYLIKFFIPESKAGSVPK